MTDRLDRLRLAVLDRLLALLFRLALPAGGRVDLARTEPVESRWQDASGGTVTRCEGDGAAWAAAMTAARWRGLGLGRLCMVLTLMMTVRGLARRHSPEALRTDLYAMH